MRKCVLLILMSLSLAACKVSEPTPTYCETTWQGFRNLMQQSRSPEDMRTQIAQWLGLPLNQVMVESYKNRTTFRWIKDGVEGDIVLEDSRPLAGGLDYRERPPSADVVVGCFGTPDQYRAYFQSPPPGGPDNQFTFDMFFVREGVLAGAFQYKRDKNPPRLSGNMPVQAFLFVPVGSPEDTMDRLTVNLPAQMRQQIKAWPGRWENLIIEIGPGLRQK